MLHGLLTSFLNRIADRIVDYVIVQLRKQVRMMRIDEEGQAIKDELSNAQTPAEREAVLEKIHDLVNNIDGV
jgi:predicted NBD/HSP70 family sugar kinase